VIVGGRNTISFRLLYNLLDIIQEKANEADLFEEVSLLVGPASRDTRTCVLHSNGKWRVWTRLSLSVL